MPLLSDTDFDFSPPRVENGVRKGARGFQGDSKTSVARLEGCAAKEVLAHNFFESIMSLTKLRSLKKYTVLL